MREEKGIILITVLSIILLLSIIAAGSFIVSTSESRMASIDRRMKSSFYIADAGIEEARGRMQSTSFNPIVDPSPSDYRWRVFIGPKDRVTDLQNYNSSYTRMDRLSSLDYAVSVSHKVNLSNQVLYWGDSNFDGLPEVNTSGVGRPIYVITSNGKDGNTSKTVQMEGIFIPSPTVFSALYTQGLVTINGSSVFITGVDQCGSGSVAGITSVGPIVKTGNPVIQGTPPEAPNSALMALNVSDTLSLYKGRANFTYSYNSAQTVAGNWGTPSLSNPLFPSACSDKNVVYFNMNGNLLTLTGGTKGCGMLLIDGSLQVKGGFTWNGLIIVKGDFTASAAKNITGAVISGGNYGLDSVAGNTAIIYCNQAISRVTQGLPMVVTKWME